MFAGIGGFRSGLEAVGGFECIGHCEIDKRTNMAYCAIYDTEGEYYCDDERKINTDEMPDFDLLCAGFPCQSFSVAGKRLGFEDTRGTLFFEVARLLAAKRPAFFLLENVPGLLSHDGGKTLETIYATLIEMGYRGHSLSVSDMVVIEMGNTPEAAGEIHIQEADGSIEILRYSDLLEYHAKISQSGKRPDVSAFRRWRHGVS